MWDNNLLDTDAELQFVYETCVQAGPEVCPLYESSADLIARRVQNLIHKLNTHPIAYSHHDSGDYGILRGSDVQSGIFAALYGPYGLTSILFQIIAQLEKENVKPLISLGLTRTGLLLKGLECSCPSSPFLRSINVLSKTGPAIACGEADPIYEGFEELREYYKKLSTTSQFASLWNTHAECT